MPIRDKTLEKHGEKYIILIDDNQTLDDALQRFMESGGPENDTWLVVSQPDEQYQVILLPELASVLRMMGSDSLTQPPSTLPIPPASRVVHRDTPEGGGKIIDWVANNPGSTLVITDDQGFVGLFTNPNRSRGLVGGLSLLELHGELARIRDDPRLDHTPAVPYPTCPHCGYNDGFYRYDIDKDAYTCQKCERTVEQL